MNDYTLPELRILEEELVKRIGDPPLIDTVNIPPEGWMQNQMENRNKWQKHYEKEFKILSRVRSEIYKRVDEAINAE